MARVGYDFSSTCWPRPWLWPGMDGPPIPPSHQARAEKNTWSLSLARPAASPAGLTPAHGTEEGATEASHGTTDVRQNANSKGHEATVCLSPGQLTGQSLKDGDAFVRIQNDSHGRPQRKTEGQSM